MEAADDKEVERVATRERWAMLMMAAVCACVVTATVRLVHRGVLLPGPLATAGAPPALKDAALTTEWLDYYSSLAAVSVNGASPLRTLGPALGWRHSLRPDELQRGVAYRGAAHRLRVLMQDLQAARRRELRVAVIGGSISWGAHVEKRGVDDWFSQFTAWLASTFPATTVTARNGCVPATPSAFMELCLEKNMGADADLVIMEYATNDGADVANEVGRRGYERLVRKVLSLPGAPALVLLHLPTKGQVFAPGNPAKKGFTHTVEDVYNAAAAYYQCPALSLRDAVWHLGELHQNGGNWSDYYGTETYRYKALPDYVHPTSPGHKAAADLMVWLLQTTLVGLQLQPLRKWEREEAARQLPVPMYPGNWEGPTRVCLNGAEFGSVVVANKGWELVNEGDDAKPKWGFVATTVGARLAFEVNTTRITAPDTPTLSVLMAYLKSYAHMGRARVACEGGCACEAAVVDAHHDAPTSTIYLHAMAPTQADACRISVTVLNETTSGEHKFKVTGVMARETHARIRTFLTSEDNTIHVNVGLAGDP